jgi:hypothetical protein
VGPEKSAPLKAFIYSPCYLVSSLSVIVSRPLSSALCTQ